MSDLVSRKEVYEMLNNLGGCGAQEEYSKGWDKAIDGAISELEKIPAVKKAWNYVEKVGNPKQEGEYIVTLIYDEFKNGAETGKKKAFVDTRWLGDADKDPQLKAWKMGDQPDHGLIWTQQSGSCWHEHVYAWIPEDDIPIAELPEGVEMEE